MPITWTDISTGLSGDALKIRGMNFDPFSQSGDHFTRMWAMTDDGLYLTDGLPDAENWTRKLSLADAATLLSLSEPDLFWQWSFTPSVLLSGFIMCSVGDTSTGRLYVLWSLNNGTNWNADASKWWHITGLTTAHKTAVMLAASPHFASTYYAYTALDLRESDLYPAGYNPLAAVWRSTTLPSFAPYASYGLDWMGNQPLAEFWIAYAHGSYASPTVYPDDNVVFISGHDAGAGGFTNSGTGAIRKMSHFFNPPWSVDYHTMDAGTPIGEASMPVGTLFTVHMFNDDVLLAWSGSTLWVTTNGGSTWTKTANVTIGGNIVNITSIYSIPSDPDIFYMVGALASGGIAGVAMSIDFGATFTDIGLIGDPGGIDNVLGLAAGDAVMSQIEVDYFKA